MSSKKEKKLSRREFACTMAAALSTPTLLHGLATRAPEPRRPTRAGSERKPEAAAESAEERRERTLKLLREFDVPGETEPAFRFRAHWSQ